jgi:hypothetical protein
MMDFSDIINDLVKLEGIRLNSIRPGAEITIKQVDLDQKKIIVESSLGKLHSRPFSEFQRIWEALLASPAIRVEEVLNGSGSSRNQPETIFANLPYIQWLKIDNKKHIAYVKSTTHPYGTIQEMDGIQAAHLINKITKTDVGSSRIVLVVTDDISSSAKILSSLTGTPGNAQSEGYYTYNINDQTIVLADTSKLHLPCGTYAQTPMMPHIIFQNKVSLLGYSWAVINESNIKAIVRL